MSNKGKEPALEKILSGELYIESYSVNKLKSRLIQEAILPEACCKCEFNEQRVTDYRVPLLLNYQVSASNLNGTIGVVSGNPGIFTSLFATSGDIFPTVNANILGYLNPTNGIYSLGNTPNIPIIFSASLAVTASSFSMTASLGVFGGNNFDTLLLPTASFLFDPIDHALDPILYPKSSSLKIEGLIHPIEGQQILLKNLYNNSEPANWGNLRLILTQSTTPVPGIGAQTILEPYITTPFINSDYDVLMNNAVINRPNSLFLDVDFADSQILPINQQAILSSSASPAVIQDSYYSSNWWASSRFWKWCWVQNK